MLAHTTALAAGALLIEAAVGYPDAVFQRLRHPVVWIGALLAALERHLNHPGRSFAIRRFAGLVALTTLLTTVGLVTVPIDLLARHPLGWGLAAVLSASLPAQRSLHAHVRAVADALDRGGLEAGRRAVSKIVGRNPLALDEAGVARAAIESLAENFSDGVVAPALWIALGGLTGGALYKAVNTADSMIGHRSDRYRAFGWAAARLDDLVNLPASRLSVVWLLAAAALTGARPAAAWAAVRRDARHHRSPNAGWPEAAVAGALGVALAGPRVYGDEPTDDPFVGGPRRDVTSADIRRALRLYRVAAVVQITTLVLLAAGLEVEPGRNLMAAAMS